ncbi:MAG: C40 family peptidase [Chitinophagaceae bacterium]|nr:C40 family peptidase [Chitinophagaceae bacterium]MCB9045812.1 C40 family peptidase [Chitinophagales bacterium]
MVLSYAFCNSSLVPVRSEPTHRAEMVTQLLFGDRVEILEINDNDWARIHCNWDDYIGWAKLGQLSIIDKKDYRKEARYIADKHHNKLVFEHDEQWVPMGSDLFGIKMLHKPGKYKGKKLAIKELEATPNHLANAAMQYMNAPYLWGGRSIAGIDCSGLTQMAFKMCGMAIRRDASQQAEDGELVDFLQNARKGDLAFFDNEEGKITHVGLLLDNTSIIHATDTSGKVVVDKIDPEGIVSKILRKRTHKLRMIKRYC